MKLRFAILKGQKILTSQGKYHVITEVLPEVRSLSRGDELKLIQVQAQGLERDEAEIIELGRNYPV